GDEQRLIAIGHLICGAIKCKDIASGISESSHDAAAARSSGFGNGQSFSFESFAFIRGTGDEYGAATFAVGIAGLRGMPGDIDVALQVRCHGAAAVEAIRVSDHVAFGLEGGAGVIHASVKQGMFVLIVSRQGGHAFAHSVPRHMDPAIFAESQLGSANRPNGHGSMSITVDLYWF